MGDRSVTPPLGRLSNTEFSLIREHSAQVSGRATLDCMSRFPRRAQVLKSYELGKKGTYSMAHQLFWAHAELGFTVASSFVPHGLYLRITRCLPSYRTLFAFV